MIATTTRSSMSVNPFRRLSGTGRRGSRSGEDLFTDLLLSSRARRIGRRASLRPAACGSPYDGILSPEGQEAAGRGGSNGKESLIWNVNREIRGFKIEVVAGRVHHRHGEIPRRPGIQDRRPAREETELHEETRWDGPRRPHPRERRQGQRRADPSHPRHRLIRPTPPHAPECPVSPETVPGTVFARR